MICDCDVFLGGCELNQDDAVSPGAGSEEAVLDWFVEELASYEAADMESKRGTPAAQVSYTSRDLHPAVLVWTFVLSGTVLPFFSSTLNFSFLRLTH